MPSPTHPTKHWLKKYEKPHIKWSQTCFFCFGTATSLGCFRNPWVGLGAVVHAYNPRTLGGWGRWITWGREFKFKNGRHKATLTQDRHPQPCWVAAENKHMRTHGKNEMQVTDHLWETEFRKETQSWTKAGAWCYFLPQLPGIPWTPSQIIINNRRLHSI